MAGLRTLLREIFLTEHDALVQGMTAVSKEPILKPFYDVSVSEDHGSFLSVKFDRMENHYHEKACLFTGLNPIQRLISHLKTI